MKINEIKLMINFKYFDTISILNISILEYLIEKY